MGGYGTVILLLFVCPVSFAFIWSTDIQDGAELYACVGDTVTFPWNFALADGQVVEDIKWYFQREGFSRQSVAGTVDGTFFSLPAFARRLDHVTTAGIQLKNVTDADTGNYSVVVTVLNGTTYSTFQHTSTLTVAADALVSRRGSDLLLQQQRVAVYDNSTRQFHVQLICGNFRITGYPPVAVEFTYPSGQKDIVSVNNRGNFSLLLPNPVEGGTYSCRLLADYPPVSCLPTSSNVLSNVTVSIDEVRARMSLIEAEQRMLLADNDELRKENSDLREMLDNQTQFFLQEVSELTKELNEIQEEKALGHISFHVQLSTDVSVSSAHPVLFDRIINNNGEAYNSSTGRFTAPLNSTYFFAATCAATNSDVSFSMHTLTRKVCQARAPYGSLYDRNNRQWSATCHASLHLAEGDEVWVEVDSAVSVGGTYSTFTGFSVDVV